MKLRVTTFNCENLFGRYRFLNNPPGQQPKDYIRDIQIYDVISFQSGRKGMIKPQTISEAQRRNTGETILAAAPDILGVCEVENLTTLRLFNAKYLNNYFDRIILIDGNDPRGIDVGLLVRRGFKADVRSIRTHADDAITGGYLETTNMLDMRGRLGKASFSRDCLEVDIDIAGTMLTFMVNHFKAQETQFDGSDPTTDKRMGQAKRASFIARRARSNGRLPIVMGDLNKDVLSKTYDNSLNTLVKSSVFINPVKMLPPLDRWTHYFASRRTVSQLDYILPDKNLGSMITGVDIFRGGLAPNVNQYDGPRIGTIDVDGLEASDHCPLSVDFDL